MLENYNPCAGSGDYRKWDTRLASQKWVRPKRVSRFLLRQSRREKVIHCPSDEIGCPEEVAQHLAGYEVSQDPNQGAKRQEWCSVCGHKHVPIQDGGHHID